MNRRALTASSAVILGLCLTGCSSSRQAASPSANMGMGGSNKVLTLAAGDSLGRAVYVNDMIIAANAIEQNATYTNVEIGATEMLITDH